MQKSYPMPAQRILKFLAGVFILKVTVQVLLGYDDYFPANFDSDFLRGREAYFAGAYQWAFYLHVVPGPIALVLGLVLVSERFRRRYLTWHRALGKLQVLLVLLLLTPSGLWMAYYAESGAIAALGFSALAIATAACVVLGWRYAVQRQIEKHRRWMWRCFLLLCSAVVLRLLGGLATVADVGEAWSYPAAAWASWLLPLAAYELGRAARRRLSARGQSAPSAALLSPPAMEMSARR